MRASSLPKAHRTAWPGLDFPLPFTTVDVVIFTVLDEVLNVLLVQRPESSSEPFPRRWALPGGFVNLDQDATLQSCAARKLRDKTGVVASYLEQLGSWGGAKRDPRGWSATHVYFALVNGNLVKLQRGANAADVGWFPIDRLPMRPGLAFDHREILDAAIERLRSKVEYTSLPAFFLGEPFSLPELQRMYQVVLGRAVDKSGFRTRMLSMNFLEETGPLERGGSRAAMGYRLSSRADAVVFPRTFSPRNS